MTKLQNRIPKFKNIKEEAKFWDTHDFTEYKESFKPIQVKFAKNLSDTLNVRFEPKDITKIRVEAQKKGIGPTTLVRMWVKEHLYVV